MSGQVSEPTGQISSTVSTGSYEITGSRDGTVIVKDKISRQVIRRFQMGKGVVRELFLLDDGKIVAASQAEHTVFWDLATGQKLKKFNQRIYGFSHNKTRFFTFSQGKSYGMGKVSLYNYPQQNLLCELATNLSVQPETFVFSPNDQFLAILFSTAPDTGRVIKNVIISKMFNIETCEEIEEFSELRALKIGEFSQDSKFYQLMDTELFIGSNYQKGSWQFNLTTFQLQNLD